jgi:hypothetical protein
MLQGPAACRWWCWPGSRSQPVERGAGAPAIEQFLLNDRKRKLVEDDLKALRGGQDRIRGQVRRRPAAGAAAAPAPTPAPAARCPAAPADLSTGMGHQQGHGNQADARCWRFAWPALGRCCCRPRATRPVQHAQGWRPGRRIPPGAGDVVRVTVYQNPDLTARGPHHREPAVVSYPLLGSVRLGGLQRHRSREAGRRRPAQRQLREAAAGHHDGAAGARPTRPACWARSTAPAATRWNRPACG